MSTDTSQSPRWSALLMAGGESRRMGHDKATLVAGSEPLWRRQVRTLRAAGFEEIMIARGALEPLGAGEPGLINVPDAVLREGWGAANVRSSAFRRFGDPDRLKAVLRTDSGRISPNCGPLGGLAAGLQRASTRWLLVLAVDMPLMPASFLRAMIGTTNADERGRGLVPMIDAQHEPLAAIYLKEPASSLAAESLRTGALSLRDLVKQLVSLDHMRELEAPATNHDFFRNVNTPEDLAEIEQRINPDSDCPIV